RVLLRHLRPRDHDDRRRGPRDQPGRPRAHPAEPRAQPPARERSRPDSLLLLRGGRRGRGRGQLHRALREMARILVTRRLPDGGLDPLDGHELVGPNADDTPFTPDELLAHAGEVDAIVSVLTDKIDASVIKAGAANTLRVVANVAVGFDNVDVATAREHGVVVCNTPGVLDETTADLAFTLILAASRLTHDAEDDLREGRWHGWGITQYLGRDVHGATLGIVGYGRIGRAVAR